MLPYRSFHEIDEAVGFIFVICTEYLPFAKTRTYCSTLSLNTLVTDEVLLRLTALFGSCGIGELQATIFHHGS